MSELINIEKSRHIIRASSTLTGAYVAGIVFSIDRHNFLGLEIVYTKGDETSAQVKIEVSTDGGVTYVQQDTETISGGTITVAAGERSFAATGNYAVVVDPIRAQLVKVSTKATGGTPTGTMAIVGIASNG